MKYELVVQLTLWLCD